MQDTRGAHIELSGVTKVYRAEHTPVPVLHGIDLSIARGERVSIMGRSGSGKSTLLNVLGCLDAPTSGSYTLDGVEVSRLDDASLSRLRNRTFGFVFQSFNLLRSHDVVENVLLPMEYTDVPPAEQRERALELLEMVGLSHRIHHRPAELSGGERQRGRSPARWSTARPCSSPMSPRAPSTRAPSARSWSCSARSTNAWGPRW